MGLFNKIRTARENVQKIKTDEENWNYFSSLIKDLKKDETSRFSKLGLCISDDSKTISYMFAIPENFQINGSETMIMGELRSETKRIQDYLYYDLDLSKFLKPVSFFHVEDTEDEDNDYIVSCTYIAVWSFDEDSKLFKGEPNWLEKIIYDFYKCDK